MPVRASGEAPSPAVLATVRRLVVDQFTREVVTALRDGGVSPILLKGPAIADWLYRDGSVRTYGDCDLLVAPDHVVAAQGVLRGLGFHDEKMLFGHPRFESHEWVRGTQRVDLHSTLIGLEAPPAEVWEALSTRTERQSMGDVDIDVLAPAARALHVALHAAQHGPRESKPLEDLTRALTVVPREQWREVAALADRLQATPAFAVGLRLVPEGRELASRLHLPTARSTDALLRLEPVPLARGFEQLATTPGVRPRATLLAREVAPTPAFMRWWFPPARRGPLGLVAGYVWRLVWLAARAGPGFMAWRRARREARRS